MSLRGLVFDWGGVLTAPLGEAMSGWAQRDNVDRDHLRQVFETWAGPGPVVTGDSPLHRVERGELSSEEFEQELAQALAQQGSVVAAPGLIDRMLIDVRDLDPRMIGAIRRARQIGVRTALLSNSWGDHYPDALWDGLFDAVVISGRVGMRKPEPEIFTHTLDLLGLPANECVMVDDMARNVHAAVAQGMVGVLHVNAEQTLHELDVLFEHSLSGHDS